MSHSGSFSRAEIGKLKPVRQFWPDAYFVRLYLNKITQLVIIYGCFCTTTVGLSSPNRDYVACKAKKIYYLVLYRKSFLNPTTPKGKISSLISTTTMSSWLWEGVVVLLGSNNGCCFRVRNWILVSNYVHVYLWVRTRVLSKWCSDACCWETKILWSSPEIFKQLKTL